ncbi:hypothetical protein [Dyella humicola]|uniref:hypothetical protein n=1 Tax=Dyella humicola TaxID=2992126 RepID=UPI00225905A7|nr:hypothetical protein [Dyella humicola]
MCRLWKAATVAALTTAIVPGLAAAADGGPELLLRGRPVAAYAGPATNARADSWDTGLASAANGVTPVAAPGAVRMATAMSEAWAFPTAGRSDWSRDVGRWSFASVTTSYNGSPDAFNLQSASLPSSTSFGANGEAAIARTQLLAGYRITPNDRIAVSYGVTATTSNLQNSRRSKAAYNFWTLTPKVAYIKTLASGEGDASTIVAVGWFSRKTNAIYQNSAVGRIETVVMRQSTGGWGVGGVAAAIEHYSRDPNTPSYGMPRNPSFDGVGLGVGPQINWNTRWRGGNIEFRYRWIYEFNGPGGHASQPMLLSATVHL